MREPHVRFDERDLETEQLPLLPRQISTLPHLAASLLFFGPDEVAKMIGAELCFKAVNRVAKWRRHHSSICDNNIERRVTL